MKLTSSSLANDIDGDLDKDVLALLNEDALGSSEVDAEGDASFALNWANLWLLTKKNLFSWHSLTHSDDWRCWAMFESSDFLYPYWF